jgi:hypothetical protein
MKVRGGEFSTGTTGNLQPELTPRALNVSKARRRWLTDRAKRSKRQQTTASKRRR